MKRPEKREVTVQDIVQKLPQLKVIVLHPFGRAASIFVHGCLERHPKICTIPFTLPFFHFGFGGATSQKALEEALSRFFDYSQPIIEPIPARIAEDTFAKDFFRLRREFSPDPRADFFALHGAWIRQFPSDPDSWEFLLWHPHTPDNRYERFLQHFLEWKLLFLVRDPRESHLSTWRNWEIYDSFPDLDSSRMRFIHHEWIPHNLFSTYYGYELFSRHRERSVYLLTEKANESPRQEMELLARNLGFDFLPCMLESTLLGSPRDPGSNQGVKGFSKTASRVRWPNHFPPDVVEMLEAWYESPLREFGYPLHQNIRGFRKRAAWRRLLAVPLVILLDRKLVLRTWHYSQRLAKGQGFTDFLVTLLRTIKHLGVIGFNFWLFYWWAAGILFQNSARLINPDRQDKTSPSGKEWDHSPANH